ncbi:helix-turn-helix domain-containing protein [Bradyrhizobium sp. 1(2017)]|uniref:helix-turn-helix domain-containing protein n=1 Tax=Bradyrhizobium sp. 1(2017) TaxID=1404888 RepID=UPI00140EB3DA|nr:AraC family transcriptional regulator [Bradyrhizobium sp. 1(2017)]QIO36899.1 helix-turn-helix transcriptional regulator [Bradyrhizobium sp. 1(2017)]
MSVSRAGAAVLTLARETDHGVAPPPKPCNANQSPGDLVSPLSTLAHQELINALLGEALALLDQDRASARRCIEGARSLIRAPDHEDRPRNCLLAEWQVRRAKEFIRNNLATCLRMELVARHVQLSASYFSRAFKATAGVSYSDFLVNARIDLAKQLLLTTDIPISEVALACGLADQSHLTRLFGRIVGLPPNTWRRQVLGAGS